MEIDQIKETWWSDNIMSFFSITAKSKLLKISYEKEESTNLLEIKHNADGLL